MKIVRVCLIAIVAAFCGSVLSPGITRADELTGSTGISWIFGGSTYASDTIEVGSSLSCSSTSATSPICSVYSDGFTILGEETFSVDSSSVSYSASNYASVGNPPYGGTIDGFELTGLTFASGDPLSSFTIASNDIGLMDADVTIGPDGSSIFVNLAGLPIDSSFTIDLTSAPAVSTPEPSSLVLLGIGLLGLIGLAGKRFASDRFAVESAS